MNASTLTSLAVRSLMLLFLLLFAISGGGVVDFFVLSFILISI